METKEEKESTQKLAGCVSSEEIFRGKRISPKEQKERKKDYRKGRNEDRRRRKNQQQNKCKIDRKGQIFVDYFSCFSFQIFTLVGVVLVDSTDYVRDAAGTRGVTEAKQNKRQQLRCEQPHRNN